MTDEDEDLQRATVDQIRGEAVAQYGGMKEFAAQWGRPYDSTRDYLKHVVPIKLGVAIEMCSFLGVPLEEMIARGRAQLRR